MIEKVKISREKKKKRKSDFQRTRIDKVVRTDFQNPRQNRVSVFRKASPRSMENTVE